jgi:hypothetical protein
MGSEKCQAREQHGSESSSPRVVVSQETEILLIATQRTSNPATEILDFILVTSVYTHVYQPESYIFEFVFC